MASQFQHRLAPLGWDDWFERRVDCKPTDTIARVVAVDRDRSLLIDHDGSFPARLAGSYRYRHPLPQQLPCVGDWVCVEKSAAGNTALVHSLLPRKTMLRRKSAGDAIEYQMIAANLDTVIVVQSCHFDFNIKRLERYLVMIRDGGAEACILLTKTDLLAPAEVESRMAEIRAAGVSAPVIALSNKTLQGVDELGQLLQVARTYCFVGSSGVGKSTLINHLLGQALQETSTVSGTGEGRHTTVRRELIRLDNGAWVIDNPGMREFGILGAEEGISATFDDIAALASACRYRDCSHTREPGCAVLEALRAGEIDRAYYDNYLKIRQESAYYQMSYADKRKKQRDFGRFVNSVKKHSKRH